MSDTKNFTIRINGINESVNGVSTLRDSLNTLSSGSAQSAAKGMDELGKATQKLVGFNAEYQRALASTKAALADKNKEIKQAIDLEGAMVTVDKNLQGSYREKQQLLTALGTVIKGMNAETDAEKQRQTELIERYNALNQQLKDFDATMGNHQRNVGDYGIATENLKGKLREMQEAMANMLAQGVSKADPAFVELAKKAGELKDAMGDAREEVDRFASDTKKLDDAIDIAKSATSAFQLFTGTMNLFGLETDGATEAIQKMMAAMSIIQSLQQLQDTMQKGSATARLFSAAMNMMTKGMQGASLGAKALRIALASIGIGIIIALVATLIEHWEDIVGWFQKTIPWCNNLTQKFKAVGSAIKNWLINPFETLAKVLKHIFNREFDEALSELQKGITKQFEGSADAYRETYQEEMTKTAITESNKRTKQQIEELEAAKGNQAKYSKEGQKLYKKDLAERKKMAKGNAEELRKIRLEEMRYDRECSEHEAAAKEKAQKQATAAAAKGAAERKKLAEEERKKQEEEAKKAAEFKEKADEAYYKAYGEWLLKNDKKLVDYYKAEVKLYESGPVEKYTEAVNKLNEALANMHMHERQIKLYDYFKDYRDNIDSAVTSVDEFMKALNVVSEQSKQFDNLTLDDFKVLAQQLDLFKKLTEDQFKYLYSIFTRYLTDGIDKAEEATSDIRKVQEAGLKKEMDGIEVATLKYETEQDKKSEKAKEIVKELEKLWNNYLIHVKAIYGEDSKEYLEAVKKRQSAAGLTSKGGGRGGSFAGRSQEDWGGKFGEKMGKVDEMLADTANVLFQNVFDPIGEAFSALLDFELEEAQEALDEATEMHDKAVKKVEESQNNLDELNEKMRNSSGAQLQAYKEQMADEQLLLIEREQAEAKAAKEKEKREKELEKKEKQQRKFEVSQKLIEAIVNTALGVTAALKWGPILGPIYAAMLGSMGAVQTAVIIKQMSKLASGGVLGGKEHKDGGVKIPSLGVEVERGEAVINKRSTAKYLPLLDAINAEGNGGKHTLLQTSGNVIRRYANGGVLNFQRLDSNSRQMSESAMMVDAIRSIDFHPVVSVVDINRGQKDLATVRQYAGGN